MHYSRKAMFKEQFPWAVQPFITHHSSLSTPGTAGTALANEKSPCLTFRGCQPTPFGLCAEAGFVPQAGGCWPCCVPSAHSPPWQQGSSPSLLLPAGTHGAALRTAGPKLAAATTVPKVPGKWLSFHTPARVCFLAPHSWRGKSCWKWKELEERTTVSSWSVPQSLLISRHAARPQGRLQSLLQAHKRRRWSISSLFPLLTIFLLIF